MPCEVTLLLVLLCVYTYQQGVLAQHQPRVKALVATAIAGEPCSTASGDYLNVLSIKNKKDYTELHGLSFYWTTEQLDPELYGPWNKIAVLQNLAHQYSPEEVEWFWWVDYDTLFVDMNRSVPWDRYENKDLVLWGTPNEVIEDKNAIGLNTGVILLRNGPYARQLLDMLLKYGRGWGKYGENGWAKAMNESLTNFLPALFDQAAVVFALSQHPNLARGVYWEETGTATDYGFHHHFLGNYPFDWMDKFPPPLVLHYAGCQACSYHGHKAGDGLENDPRNCTLHFLTVYERARSVSLAMQGLQLPRFRASDLHRQIRDLESGATQEKALRKWTLSPSPGMQQHTDGHGDNKHINGDENHVGNDAGEQGHDEGPAAVDENSSSSEQQKSFAVDYDQPQMQRKQARESELTSRSVGVDRDSLAAQLAWERAEDAAYVQEAGQWIEFVTEHL